MSPFDRVCPTCGAAVGHRCRTRRTGRTTDTHADRSGPYPPNVVDLTLRRVTRRA